MKAVFFDIDGTLVSLKTAKMCASTKTAVAQLRRKGILCFVATGRSPVEIEEMNMLEGVEFDGILSNNGQLCYAGDKVLYNAPIEPSDVAAVVRQVEELGYSAWFTEADRMYVSSVNDRVRKAMADIHTQPPAVGEIQRALHHDVYKIVAFLTPEEMQQYPMQVTKHCKAASWNPLAGDLMPAMGGKVCAIEAILRHYGIAREDSMAFGDGENDMEMIAAAGCGVAMGNATDALKKAADYVTADCEQDGLYRALVHFGLIEDTLHLCAQPAHNA